jgi:tripartite-type tricarboxylate transporter receptor subunit TctC
VRILLTFGAERHPELPDVPTLADISGNPKAAITGHVGVFAAKSAQTAVVSAVHALFSAAAADPEVQRAAAARHFPLVVLGADGLQASIEREARVIRETLDHLHD